MPHNNFPLPEAHEARHGYCEKILQDYHDSFGKFGGPGPQLPSNDAPPFRIQEDISDTCPVDKIAIVGAGVSGLYAAMMLGVNCKVDVYEASDRIGGRLYTHQFEHGGKWDYFVSLVFLS